MGLLCQKSHHCGINQGLKFISFLFESNVLLWYLILANGSSRTSCYLMNYCSESANTGLLWQYESTKQYGFRLPLNTELHNRHLSRQLIQSRLSILCHVDLLFSLGYTQGYKSCFCLSSALLFFGRKKHSVVTFSGMVMVSPDATVFRLWNTDACFEAAVFR